MMESTERVGAHELHPNFNLKNARRLIAALRESVHVSIARERPLVINGAHVAKTDLLDRRIDVDGSNPDGVPLAYDQDQWADNVPARINWNHSCGTAACIAGFAYILREADRGWAISAGDLLDNGKSNRSAEPMVDALREFLGISAHATDRMSLFSPGSPAIQPRHAVAMLEHFIVTGRVDWNHALGQDRILRRGRDWKGLRPWRVLEWFETEVFEDERGRREVDEAKHRTAVKTGMQDRRRAA